MSIRDYSSQDGQSGESSHAVISHCSRLQSSVNFSQDLKLRDTFSLNDVFSLLAEELYELINKVNHLEKECSQIQDSPRLSYLTDCSTRKNEEYSDILNKKRLFTCKLTDAVINLHKKPIGIPKYRIQCYESLASLLNKHHNETKQEILQCNDKVIKLKQESTELNLQVDTFSQLLDMEIDDPDTNENDMTKINAQFQEAKKDLGTVMSVLFKENVKHEIISTMVPLIDAFVNNYECKEDQYVEIPARSLKLSALNVLLKENILFGHSSKKRMFRLCVED